MRIEAVDVFAYDWDIPLPLGASPSVGRSPNIRNMTTRANQLDVPQETESGAAINS